MSISPTVNTALLKVTSNHNASILLNEEAKGSRCLDIPRRAMMTPGKNKLRDKDVVKDLPLGCLKVSEL